MSDSNGNKPEEIPARDAEAKRKAAEEAAKKGARDHYRNRIDFVTEAVAFVEEPLRQIAFEAILTDILGNDRLQLQAQLQGQMIAMQQQAEAGRPRIVVAPPALRKN